MASSVPSYPRVEQPVKTIAMIAKLKADAAKKQGYKVNGKYNYNDLVGLMEDSPIEGWREHKVKLYTDEVTEEALNEIRKEQAFVVTMKEIRKYILGCLPYGKGRHRIKIRWDPKFVDNV